MIFLLSDDDGEMADAPHRRCLYVLPALRHDASRFRATLPVLPGEVRGGVLRIFPPRY